MTPALASFSLYVGLCSLIFLWLTAAVIKTRKQEKVFMGDGGNPRVIRRMRGQMNFIEFVPLSLFVLLVLALGGAPVWVIHVFGTILVIGRVLHGIHFCADDAPAWQRFWGALSSMFVLLFGSIALVSHGLFGLF